MDASPQIYEPTLKSNKFYNNKYVHILSLYCKTKQDQILIEPKSESTKEELEYLIPYIDLRQKNLRIANFQPLM